MLRCLFCLVLVVAFSGCSWYSEWRIQSDLKMMRSEALKKIDRPACEQAGGKVEGIGMFGTPACVTYYSDGGVVCRSDTDSQGMCFNPEVLDVGDSAAGICERSEHDRFGCFSIIEEGKVESTMCQD